MPRLFGRLWRSGGRRAELAKGASAETETLGSPGESATGREEMGRRLEQARQRLRQTIPPPEDPEPSSEGREPLSEGPEPLSEGPEPPQT